MHDSAKRNVFVTGGTGYIGRFLIPELLQRGHSVTALVRAGSEKRIAGGATVIVGDALNQATFNDRVAPANCFVHLVGVAHPSPAKAAEFKSIDLVSVREAVGAAVSSKVSHFIYLSVAQPAPVMEAYLAVRAEGEALIRGSGMNATFVRPFYVLGPGHRWPYAVLPLFWLYGLIPSKRETAARLYPVTLKQTIHALVESVENPPTGIRIVEAPQIRRTASA